MDIGFIANPASGKDIRRLTSRASVFDNQQKASIVLRCLTGIRGIANANIHYLADTHNIVASALKRAGLDGTALPVVANGSAEDSIQAAERLRGVDVVVSLGGDGTNRAIAKGWREVPLVAVSTGTNNAFPAMIEATTAGVAAALVASGSVGLAEVSRVAKVIEAKIEGKPGDIALVDVALSHDRFLGARALTDGNALAFAVVSSASASRVGISGVVGCVRTLGWDEAGGLFVQFGTDEASSNGHSVVAPIAPGVMQRINIAKVRPLTFGEEVLQRGSGVVSLDGEREWVVGDHEALSIRVETGGPRVIDVQKTVELAAERGLFRRA